MISARGIASLIMLAGLATATPVLAHPNLLSAAPAQDTTAASVNNVTLTFSEPLMASMSGMDLLMTGMPGMDHHTVMKMTGVKVSVGSDGTSLVATLSRPLPTGNYEVDWHVASTDPHGATGKITFSVK